MYSWKKVTTIISTETLYKIRCYSYIGRIGGAQTLSLDPNCYRNGEPGTVEHEFVGVHAFGFYHEQSRTDRDDFVTINWSNIQAGNK